MDLAAMMKNPDFLARRSRASGRMGEKQQMLKAAPITPDPINAGLEGAVGAGLAVFTAMNGGGAPDGDVIPDIKTPPQIGDGPKAGLQQKAPVAGATQAVKPGAAAAPVGNDVGMGFDSFFNFFGAA